MTLSDLRTRIYDRLGENQDSEGATNTKRYPASLVLTFLKEAINQWSVAVGREVGSTTITLVANTIEYTFTTQPVRIISVMDDTIDKPLIPIAWRSLYDTEGFTRNRAWRDVTSNRPTHYSLFSYDKIWLWPMLAAVTTETITVNYIQEITSDLTSGDTEVPSVPTEFQHLLVDYVVGRCLMIGSTGPTLQRGVRLVQRWMDSFAEQRERHRHLGATERPDSNPWLRGNV